ncbi:MAG TPA: response regulator, partial [Gemmatimonadales bacterium]|nr:response regulator [Gemmatimonadales bacterium]
MAESVLVVEDDRELREFLVEVLESGGYAVSTAVAAEPALRELEHRRDIDLVLSDLVLPGSDG